MTRLYEMLHLVLAAVRAEKSSRSVAPRPRSQLEVESLEQLDLPSAVGLIQAPAAPDKVAVAAQKNSVLRYLGTVTERDSSNFVYFNGHTIARGQSRGPIAVYGGTRQTWTNSQRALERVTLRSGTTHVYVDRTLADFGRQLRFHCYARVFIR